MKLPLKSRSKLILLGGSIGAGKTTLAYALQKSLADIIVIEDDTIRRQILGFPLNYFMNHDLDSSFSEANNLRVRQEMERLTRESLGAGKSVIQCPTYNTIGEYIAHENTYKNIADCIGIYLKASEETIRARLEKRKIERKSLKVLSLEQGHASDADEAVLAKYPVANAVPEHWAVLDAEQPPEIVLEHAKGIVG